MKTARLQKSHLSGNFENRDRNRLVNIFFKKWRYLPGVFYGLYKERFHIIRNPELSSWKVYPPEYQPYWCWGGCCRILRAGSQGRHSGGPRIAIYCFPFAADTQDKNN